MRIRVRPEMLRRGDVFETREGVCRVGPPMAREHAQLSPHFRTALAPHAEQLARRLSGKP